MRDVSTLFKRAALALLVAALLDQSAYAVGSDDPRGPRGGFWQRVRHLIVHALDEISIPPHS